MLDPGRAQAPATGPPGADAVARIDINFKNPDLIIIPAFEGGHPDHDITNYITYRITKKINSSNIKLLETPLYNNYFFSDIFFLK